MRLTITLIILVLVAVGLTALALANPGTTTIVWLGYEVELPVMLLVVGVLALAGVVAVAYRVLLFVRAVPNKVRGARDNSRHRRGYEALTQGMVAVAAGDAEQARIHAKQAETLLEDPPLTMLLSAQAAQLSGDETAAQRFFESMMERPEMAFLGMRGRLTQALKEGDRETALEIAQKAHREKPRAAWVSDNLFDLQVHAAQWEPAEETLNAAIRARLTTSEESRPKFAILYHLQSIDAEKKHNKGLAFNLAKKAQRMAPDFVPGVARLANLMYGDGKLKKADRLITETWATTPHPALAAGFRAGQGRDDAALELTRAKALLAANPAHPESHVALAEAALRAEDWAQARSHLDAASNGTPTARLCLLYAELEEREHGDPVGTRQWLRRALAAPADEAWTCGNCGNVVESWEPVCGQCDSFGSFDWRRPPRLPADLTPHGEVLAVTVDSADPALDASAEKTAVEISAPVAGQESKETTEDKTATAAATSPEVAPEPEPTISPPDVAAQKKSKRMTHDTAPAPAEAATGAGMDDDDRDISEPIPVDGPPPEKGASEDVDGRRAAG
ncbi:MAG: heme biosynthesis protein HemY [Magnetospiraceae bacterium]